MKRMYVLLAVLCLFSGMLTGCKRPEVEVNHPAETVAMETQPTPSTAEEETEAETQPPVDTDRLLQDALAGVHSVISPDGQSEKLPDYLKSRYKAVPTAYTFVDFDWDGQKEMVICTDREEASTIVLHCSEEDVFLHPFSSRELMMLKTDGSFYGSSGAANAEFYTLRFNGGGLVNVCQGKGNHEEGVYELDGNVCSESAFVEFEEKWYDKADAIWIPLEVRQEEKEETLPESELPYLENIPHADQAVLKGPSYDYGMVRTVEKAGIYTIVEEVWDQEGNLWGKLKSGAGWVDLTQIRSEESIQMPMTANYADDRLLDTGNYHYCVADSSEYMVQVAFRAQETLRDVSLFTAWSDGDLNIGKEIYYISQMTPDKPLVADVAFPGDMSMYGISFVDSDGIYRTYIASVSGRNGMLIFTEFIN